MVINASCTRCHARRTRCDEKTPCGPCVAQSEHHSCYRRQRKRRRIVKEELVPAHVHGNERDDEDEVDRDAISSLATPAIGLLSDEDAIECLQNNLPSWSASHFLIEEVFRLHGYTITGAMIQLNDVMRLIEHYHKDPPSRTFMGPGALATIGSILSFALLLAVDDDLASIDRMDDVGRRLHLGEARSTALHRRLAHNKQAESLAWGSLSFLHNAWQDRSRSQSALFVKTSATLGEVQAGILLLYNNLLPSNEKKPLFANLIDLSKSLSLDKMNDASLSATANAVDRDIEVIRIESSVRCWWVLVVRSWMTAPLTWSYEIKPSSFDTRRPCPGVPAFSLASTAAQAVPLPPGWDPVRFLLSLIELSIVVRTSVDERNESENLVWSSLQRKTVAGSYARVALAMPDFYSFAAPLHDYTFDEQQRGMSNGKRSQKCPTHNVERWLLHRYVFANIVQLHSDEQEASEGPCSVCVWMGHSILDSMHTMHGTQRIADSMHVSHSYAFASLKIHLISLKSRLRNDALTGQCQESSSRLLLQLSKRRIEEALLLIDATIDEQKRESSTPPLRNTHHAAQIARRFRTVFKQFHEPKTYVEMRDILQSLIALCAQADLQIDEQQHDNGSEKRGGSEEVHPSTSPESWLELPIQTVWASLSSQALLDMMTPDRAAP